MAKQFKDICPLIEAFHIPDIEGAVVKKQWLLSYRTTTDGTGVRALTISTISGGLIDRFESYQVLVQQIGAIPPVIIPEVDFKTTGGFRITGDASSAFSVIVLGVEGVLGGKIEGLKNSGKWAWDYCPYCKAQKIKGLVGSIFTDQIAAAFSMTSNIAGVFSAIFDVVTQTTGSDTDPDTAYVTYRDSGLQKHSMTAMKDATYEMFVAPVSTPGAVFVPVVTTAALVKSGFAFAADPTVKYDVLVVGQIEQ